MSIGQYFTIQSTLAAWVGAAGMVLPLLAQDGARKHSMAIGGGVALPAADLRQYVSSSFLLRLSYGYRLHRNLQADVGVEGVFGAAGVHTVQQSAIGNIQIHDAETLVPFGARAILPLAQGRFELHGGGGGMYLRYSEEASVPEGVTVTCIYGPCAIDIACPACRSRDGWGYYWLAGTAISLDPKHRYWLGLETRFVNGATSGQGLGSLPEFRTKDQWLNTAVEFGWRF
jgi:hypothetical protein